jgi:hypothetical protein
MRPQTRVANPKSEEAVIETDGNYRRIVAPLSEAPISPAKNDKNLQKPTKIDKN